FQAEVVLTIAGIFLSFLSVFASDACGASDRCGRLVGLAWVWLVGGQAVVAAICWAAVWRAERVAGRLSAALVLPAGVGVGLGGWEREAGWGGEYGGPGRLVSYGLEASPSRRPPLPAGRGALACGQIALQLEHRGRSEPHHGPEAPGLTRSRLRRHTIRTRVQILGARWYRLVSVRSTRRAVCLFLARLLVRDPDSWYGHARDPLCAQPGRLDRLPRAGPGRI